MLYGNHKLQQGTGLLIGKVPQDLEIGKVPQDLYIGFTLK